MTSPPTDPLGTADEDRVWIVWNDPLCTAVDCVVNMVARALPEDIVRYTRHVHPDTVYESDQDALDEFMIVHWAWRERIKTEIVK